VPISVFRSRALLELEYYQKDVVKMKFTCSRVAMMVLEIALLLLQPYPFLNDCTFTTLDVYDSVPFDFKVNYLLVLLSMFRLYAAFRGLLHGTDYMNPRSNRISRMYVCKADFNFAMKCLFRDYHTEVTAAAFLISIGLFSFAMRVCERQLKTIPDIVSNFQF